jgi:hypothetical protein
VDDQFTLWDVEGVPVWVNPDGVAEAFDDMPPRRFPYAAVLKNGRRISGDEFVELARSQAYRHQAGPDEPPKKVTSGGFTYHAAPRRFGQAFVDNLNLNVLLEHAGLIPPPP